MTYCSLLIHLGLYYYTSLQKQKFLTPHFLKLFWLGFDGICQWKLVGFYQALVVSLCAPFRFAPTSGVQPFCSGNWIPGGSCLNILSTPCSTNFEACVISLQTPLTYRWLVVKGKQGPTKVIHIRFAFIRSLVLLTRCLGVYVLPVYNESNEREMAGAIMVMWPYDLDLWPWVIMSEGQAHIYHKNNKGTM